MENETLPSSGEDNGPVQHGDEEDPVIEPSLAPDDDDEHHPNGMDASNVVLVSDEPDADVDDDADDDDGVVA